MAKNMQALKTAFPIAAVWFGALVGPSMVSGAFAAVYFAPYGLWGLLLPLVAMGVASIIVICGLFGVKAWHVDNYADYGKKLYGPLAKYLSPLLEVYLILAMLVGGSAVIVMGGSFFHDWLHLSPLTGEILMALLSTVLVLWGAELLRRASALMTVILLAGFALMVGLACLVGRPALTAIWANGHNLSLQTLLAGLGPAVALGLSNACNALTLSSVAQKIRTNREVWLAGGCAFLMNSLVFIGCVLFLLPFLPEALQVDMPNPYIIQHYLARSYPWLTGVYNLIMLLGLVSSGAPQLKIGRAHV